MIYNKKVYKNIKIEVEKNALLCLNITKKWDFITVFMKLTSFSLSL